MADDDQDIRPALDILQSMIDISADRLVGLRTQCSTSVELTQREIRTLEGKLIKLFSKQLVIKSKLKDRFYSSELKHIPSLEQWLQVVGLCSECIQCICSKVKSIEALQEKPHCKLRNLLCNCSHQEEEFRRLTTALKNLKRYIDILLEDGGDIGNSVNDAQLHWDSWDWRHTLRVLPQVIENSVSLPQETLHHNGNTAYVDQLGNINSFNNNCSVSYSVPPTPTPPSFSPPITPVQKGKDNSIEKSPGSVSVGNENCRYHHRHNYTELLANDASQPISKSRSHESPLFNLSSSDSSSSIVLMHENGPVRNRRGRLSTVPGLEHVSTNSSLYSSPTRSPPYITTSVTTITTITFDTPVAVKACDNPLSDNVVVINGSTIPVPRSPRTPIPIPRGMAHDIAHRFTKHFSFNKPCDYCCKPIIMNTGLKCKECRYRCHRDCESKVPHSCGLPPEFVNEFKRRIIPESYPSSSESPVMNRSPSTSGHPSPGLLSQIERRGGSDSTPASSSHSSAPSSPALFLSNHNTQLQPPATASAVLSQKQQFDFSTEIVNKEKDHLINSQESTESNTVSDGDRTDSDKTVNRESSQDSQNWDGESVDKVWPRQYSVSMKEWEIPWDELKTGEKLGTGHFGTVYSGYWHGDVAIKVLNMECSADEKMLENFKSEVSTFRKTRHDNLVLFMGACMKPPRLAIVTSMVHGMTLYKYIHLRKDKFSMSKTTIIAQQISQGMGYLHAKGIVHKDLRTKNIFLEKERIIITDFGLFSVTKLCFKNRMQDGLIIPPGWLCYLAPEIMRNLRVHVRPDDEHLPFSKATDVYAFGTVWYELLCGDWPFSSQNPEAIIWQVGKGMKPSLANLEASRDVKDILMHCWSYQAGKRPDFTTLLKTLDKLPKKRLARSPSHPVHLSRSAESMF